jgi:superfamily II DNA or RNA helicase
VNPPVLRTYQHDAVEAVFKEWETHPSTMVVMATGLGKTVTFCDIVRRIHPKRSIIIAHRTELIQQACASLNRIGIKTEIEMGDAKADASMFYGESTIVASVQSLISGPKESRRMTKFRPEDFALLVIDEAHHAVADSYRSVIEHFQKNPSLKILAVTATPDRLDERALGQIVNSVAYKYDIAEAIEDGYLVPIEQQMVRINSLDFSKVRTTAGDLNGGDLAEVMEDEKNLQGMVGASIQIIGNRSTIAFTASVRHAEMCCEIFNRHRAGMAAWICGKTPEDERRSTLKKFKNGEVQVIANVGIATEGFDAPGTECIIIGRPTKSRALYTQMVGRGTRALAGTLDQLHSAFERREAIAESPKPACLVLDFVGNSGKHKLVTTADILGGKYDEETRAMAVADVSESGSSVRMADALKKADQKIRERIEQQKRAEAARKARLIAEVKFSTQKISPFDVFQITPKKDSPFDRGRPLSEKQKAILLKMGVNPDELGGAACRQLLHKHFERQEKGLCTAKQAMTLAKNGWTADEVKKMTFAEAHKHLDDLQKNNWVRPDLLQLA